MHDSETLIATGKLLLKKLNRTITASEEKELEQLIETNEGSRKLAERVLSRDFLCHAILDDNKDRERRAWRQLAAQVGLRSVFRWRYAWRAVAASVALLLCGSSWYYYKYVDEPVIEAGSSQGMFYVGGEAVPLEGNTVYLEQVLRDNAALRKKAKTISPDLYVHISVPRGGEYRVVLADSTRIHLNAESSLYVAADFSPANRNISLAGEAYLEVHPDARHPFTIQTEKAHVRVLGTELNIEAYEDDPVTTVTLVKGRLELSAGGEPVEIPEGCSAVIGDERRIRVAPCDLYECTAWHNHRIVFNAAPMEDIMRKLGRWYDIIPVFGSDSLRNLRITVDIDKSDTFNQMARLIEKLNEVNIKITRNRVLLSGKKNKH